MLSRAKILVLEAQTTFNEGIERLLRAVRDGSVWMEGSASSFLRIELCVQNQVPLVSRVTKSRAPQKFYWSDRARSYEWAGLGKALVIEANDGRMRGAVPLLQRVFDTLGADIQLFAAARFDALSPVEDRSWASFGQSTVVLPAIELRSDKQTTRIAVNINPKAPDAASEASAMLSDLSLCEYALMPKVEKALSSTRVMNFETWSEAALQNTALLHQEELEKIVLANAQDFAFEKEVDPSALLSSLDERSPSTYRFLMQLSPHHAFVGASPELLFARNGLRIESEAQAGTRRRGIDAEEDAALASELLCSDKEFLEHDLVFKDIEKALVELCRDSGCFETRQVIKLSHVQHLRSRFGGIAKEGVTDADILEALHPTPAVCGQPKERALLGIRKLEQFDRGFYCGPIGLVGKNRTEFAVALRSALISDHKVRVFAGAGLVKGSKARDEWNEIDSKMRLYNDIFGIEAKESHDALG